jgi:alternate signal-mediated exported protein
VVSSILRSVRTAVSCVIALVVALAFGVIGANALWRGSVPMEGDVGTGSFALDLTASEWSETTPGIAVVDRHGSDAVADIASQWVTVRGDTLVVTATLETTLAGTNVAATLVATPPTDVPAGMTGTMTFKSQDGQVLASSPSLDTPLRWEGVESGTAKAVYLEIAILVDGLTYIDPTLLDGPDPVPATLGEITVSLEQTRPGPDGGDTP